MKTGDYVHCLGEAQTIFRIEEVNGQSAYLHPIPTNNWHGWEALHKLTRINKAHVKRYLEKELERHESIVSALKLELDRL